MRNIDTRVTQKEDNVIYRVSSNHTTDTTRERERNHRIYDIQWSNRLRNHIKGRRETEQGNPPPDRLHLNLPDDLNRFRSTDDRKGQQ